MSRIELQVGHYVVLDDFDDGRLGWVYEKFGDKVAVVVIPDDPMLFTLDGRGPDGEQVVYVAGVGMSESDARNRISSTPETPRPVEG